MSTEADQAARPPLLRITIGKAVINTAIRWIPFFLPTLSAAFASTTARLTTVIGIGEMAGLSTLVLGRSLDRGRERVVMAAALALAAVSAIVALSGQFWLFALSYVLLAASVSAFTVGGHTFLSRRVPYARRARSIGIFEISWALALLVGAPVIALLINGFGWRGPFVVLAGLCALMGVVTAISGDDTVLLGDATAAVTRQPLTPDALILIAASASIAVTGLTTIVIAGTWLDEALGVSTGGVGLVAMAFGAAELIASSTSAAIADRAGPVSATRVALALAMAGMVIMTQAGSSLPVGALGLLLFFLGFEFAIVTSFSIVSEAMPNARGRALAANNAAGTLARGGGIVLSGVLYERYGVQGPVTVSLIAATCAVVLLSLSAYRLRLGAAT